MCGGLTARRFPFPVRQPARFRSPILADGRGRQAKTGNSPCRTQTSSSEQSIFHGQTLAVITGPAGERLVAMKPICEAIGLQWEAQLKRIKRHPVLSQGMSIMTTPSAGGDQETTCLPLDYLNGWLFGMDASRVKPEIRERLVQYQRECFAALAAYWQQGEAVRPRTTLPAGGTAAPLRLTYNDRHFRIVPVGTEVWFVAADVASAVGLRDSYVATRHLRPEHKAALPVGRQTLNVISRAGLELALLHAHPERVAPLSRLAGRGAEPAAHHHCRARTRAPARGQPEPGSTRLHLRLPGPLPSGRARCRRHPAGMGPRGRPAHLRQYGRPADPRQTLGADLRRQGRTAAPSHPQRCRRLHPPNRC
ncbi:phage antirepressor N-terminal domain-containing protein [Azotobacter vinelandii]